MTGNPVARLFRWRSRAVFVGPSFGLSPHRNAVDVLAIGIDAAFHASADGGAATIHRVLHIPANTLHHLTGMEGRMAFLYVDPFDHDRKALARLAEQPLVAAMRDLADGTVDAGEAGARLDALLPARRASPGDPRISKAAARIAARPGERPSLEHMAAEAGLSPSRFRHLFVETTGVPFRRYRLWAATGAALARALKGDSLTTAAIDAGFSSSAHFSAAFREMFGMTPQALVAGLRQGQAAPPGGDQWTKRATTSR